jgi:hypothetical protein
VVQKRCLGCRAGGRSCLAWTLLAVGLGGCSAIAPYRPSASDTAAGDRVASAEGTTIDSKTPVLDSILRDRAFHDASLGDVHAADARTDLWVSDAGARDAEATDAKATDAKAPADLTVADKKATKDQTVTDGGGPTYGWIKQIGGALDDAASDVAVDSKGNVYLTGAFQGSVNLGGGTVTSVGGFDIYLTSFDSSGTYRWSKHVGSTGEDRGVAVAVDGSNNVIIAGYFSGTLSFGGSTLTSAGATDIFVAKFDASGTHLYSKSFGSTADDEATGVGVDVSGNIYLQGSFSGSVSFGGSTLTAKGTSDIFVVSFDPSLGHNWSQSFGCTGQGEYPSGIAVDSSGNVFITGILIGSVDFGGGVLIAQGTIDAYIAAYDYKGIYRWAKRYGTVKWTEGLDIAVDKSGNVYATGHFYGTVDFGGGGITAASGISYADIFLASYSSSGTHRWSKGLGGILHDHGTGVVADASGNVYLAAYFSGAVSFGGPSLTSAGGYDIVVASYDATTGAYRWAKRYGSTGNDQSSAVAVDASGNVYLAGGFVGTVDFGGTNLTSAGSADGFLLQLVP